MTNRSVVVAADLRGEARQFLEDVAGCDRSLATADDPEVRRAQRRRRDRGLRACHGADLDPREWARVVGTGRDDRPQRRGGRLAPEIVEDDVDVPPDLRQGVAYGVGVSAECDDVIGAEPGKSGQTLWVAARRRDVRGAEPPGDLHRHPAGVDPDILRAQEPWLGRWTGGGLTLRDAMDAAELVTSYVVGFTIEEQERVQSEASDPERYSVAARDAAVGPDAPLVTESGHARGDADARFGRQLDLLLAGLVARFG